jgi:hypothetical protein
MYSSSASGFIKDQKKTRTLGPGSNSYKQKSLFTFSSTQVGYLVYTLYAFIQAGGFKMFGGKKINHLVFGNFFFLKNNEEFFGNTIQATGAGGRVPGLEFFGNVKTLLLGIISLNNTHDEFFFTFGGKLKGAGTP